MIFLTVIARLADGLLLAASIQEDEKLERDLQHYQSQAKQLLRKLNAQSPDRCMLEAGNMNFCYFISQGVCCLCLCDASFPKKMAFGYLEDLHNEFCEQYGKRVPTVTRPYSFIEFDEYIQKTKKSYVDNRAPDVLRILSSVNTELEEVQRIMVANIKDVLQRKPISALDNKADKLRSYVKEYRNSSSPSATLSTYTKVVAVVLVLVTLIIIKKTQDHPTSPFWRF